LSSTTVASLCRKRVFLFLRQNYFRCCGFSPPEGFPPPPPPTPSPDDGLLHQRTSVIRLKTIKVWATKQAGSRSSWNFSRSLSLSLGLQARGIGFSFVAVVSEKKPFRKKTSRTTFLESRKLSANFVRVLNANLPTTANPCNCVVPELASLCFCLWMDLHYWS
jgi:hypothetical protein